MSINAVGWGENGSGILPLNDRTSSLCTHVLKTETTAAATLQAVKDNVRYAHVLKAPRIYCSASCT